MLDPKIRLHEIDHELDKTDPWENPPYRSKRAKLIREQGKLTLIASGLHPSQFADRSEGKTYQELKSREKSQYRLKKQILRIKRILE